jgi:hypothetical protein
LKKVEISDFKMFEDAAQEIPDPKALIEVCMMAPKEGIKFYGPAYTPRFIECALKFVSKKIGEKPPEDIKDLEQLTEYLVSISDKYPFPANALIYAGIEVGNMFEGQLAAGLRVATTPVSRRMVKSLGSEERKIDVENVLSQYRQSLIAMKVAHQELGYKRNEDGSIDILCKCYVWDACQSALDEGLLRRPGVGGLVCVHSQSICMFFKLITGYDCDYDLVEYDKSHCILRIYIL